MSDMTVSPSQSHWPWPCPSHVLFLWVTLNKLQRLPHWRRARKACKLLDISLISMWPDPHWSVALLTLHSVPVCLSVCPVASVYLILEKCGNFTFSRHYHSIHKLEIWGRAQHEAAPSPTGNTIYGASSVWGRNIVSQKKSSWVGQHARL